MAALNTDLLKKLSRRWVGQIGSGGVADASVATIPLASTTNLATDTAVVATIDRVDANGTATPSLEETVIGVVSGSNLVTSTRGVEGTAQAHSAGAVVEILVTAKGWNDIVDMLLVQHSQLGAHTNITASNITASAVITACAIDFNAAGAASSMIRDANDNELMKFTQTASAVNEVTVTNAATGNAPSVAATGGDTDIDLNLVTKGSGVLKVNGVALSSGAMTDAGNYVKPVTDGDEIRAYHSDGTSYIEAGNDGTDSKITSGTGHLVLTPASSKLVKISVLHQAITTNTYQNNAIVLTGWGHATPGAVTVSFADITFGVTFSNTTQLTIVGSPYGYKDSDPTSNTDYTSLHNDTAKVVGAFGPLTTSTARMTIYSTNNMTASRRYIYNWIAIGILS